MPPAVGEYCCKCFVEAFGSRLMAWSGGAGASFFMGPRKLHVRKIQQVYFSTPPSDLIALRFSDLKAPEEYRKLRSGISS